MAKTKKFKDASNLQQSRHSKTAEVKKGIVPERSVTYQEGDWILSFVLGSVTLAVYISTLYPSLPGGDSGELIVAAQELGVAHPPGYPLFVLLGWVFIHVIPYGGVAWRVNLSTAVMSAAASVLLSQATLKLTGRPGCAVFMLGMWGWSSLTWTWSITGEVFGMNNFFVAAVLLLMVYFDEAEPDKKVKIAHLGAFVCGLSLCNQHTMVIYVFVVAIWVLMELSFAQKLDGSRILTLGLAGVSGLSPYLFLPLSSWLQRARWTWGEQTTVAGLLTHLLRLEYGTFDLGKDEKGQGFIHNLQFYCHHFLTDFGAVPGVLVCAAVFFMSTGAKGIKESFKGQMRFLQVAIFMSIVYLGFFCWRANLDMDNPLFLGVVERFWIQNDIIIMIIAVFGFNCLIKKAVLFSPISWMVETLRADVIMAAALAGTQLVKNYPLHNQSNNTVVQEFGQRILGAMPPNALVLTKGDLPSNTLRYLYLCEQERQDIKMFDQEVMTYEWSVSKLAWANPNITFPGDKMYLRNAVLHDGTSTFNFKAFLDANYKRGPIYACIGVQEHEHSWKSHYDLWPFGVCHMIIHKGHAPDLDIYWREAMKMSQGWHYPYEGFASTSWERVATNEMWHAKISLAYFLFEKGDRETATERKTKYLQIAYQLYKKSLEENSDFPAFWHKNFGLVCERLLRLGHGVDHRKLREEMIQHFTLFVNKDPSDKDREAIISVIKSLDKQRS